MFREVIQMKRIVAVSMSMIMLVGGAVSTKAYAFHMNDMEKGTEEVEYEEYREQINLENINVVVEGDDILFRAKEDISRKERKETRENAETLTELVNRDENIQEMLVEHEKEESLAAIAYTQIPLQWDESGNLVRVEKETTENMSRATTESETGQLVNGGSPYFTLLTSVSRGTKIATGANAGKYKYTCKTIGIWDKNSALGGSKYPASGKDFILQATPSNMVRKSDDLYPKYSHSHDAKEGTDYFRNDGGTNFVQYSVKDDPLGTSQLQKVTLTTSCIAGAKSGRMINSYYVHTWKSMSLGVSVTVGSKENTSLTLNPGIKDKSWTCYSYVQFDF